MDLLLTTISSASYDRETEAHGDCVHGEDKRESAET